jgi:hypothetical protein
MADPKREIRKHLMIMVALILAIDAVAIVVFRAMGLDQASRDRKMIFTGVWTLLSLLTVLNGLYRIRLARNSAARTRR